ncbi:unannotated protein [freshwater metagenome]|uniref:Unannotated protein n=1 Tax=freshwater metagenome TaxID=449393 RepID=A0A6J7CIZ1_9ZZZZ
MRVVVVGAGLAGLTAARQLADAGHQVTVFDKGRSPGGRLATRRIGTGRFDHGAQFFTVRSDRFAALVAPHIETGLVFEWCRGFSAEADGYPRYAVRGGMNAWAKVLARGLDVRCSSLVFAIRRGSAASGAAWDVALDDGSSVAADALVVTCPLPQSYSLLVSAEVTLPEELLRTEYDRTVALLLSLDRSPAVAEPGGLNNPTDRLSFVADNQRKGISDAPALTVHANAAWSEEHWDDAPAVAIEALLTAAGEYIGDALVLEAQLKKWRFATPRTLWPEPCWTAANTTGPLVLAGDAFAGPRIEGAVLSGLAAAAALLG